MSPVKEVFETDYRMLY